MELPPEDQEDGMCGKLKKSMYGTRDAANNLEAAYTEFLTELGFTKGLGSPCMFHHEGRNTSIVVHGDDFTVLGSAADLDWFRDKISEKFEVKFKARLGPENSDDELVRVLNRVVV